jgi:signal transduction histidine kinase
VADRSWKSLSPVMAAGITELMPQILGEYEVNLAEVGSPLLRSSVSRSQILSHARQLLDDLVDNLNGHHAAITRRTLAADIGSSRAAQGFYPGDSLRAAGVLFDVVMRASVVPARATESYEEALLAVSLNMNAVLVRALGVAADSYAAFQLDRIHEAHVEERRRISRELHDRIGHGVSLAYRNLELYDIYHTTRPAEAHGRVATASESLRETLDAVRQVISDLRVAEPLDSLEKALRYFLETVQQPDIEVVVQVTGDEHWASSETRDDVFLIVREALRNVFAHAQAGAVMVRVQIAPDELRATIRDDGIGFEPAEISGAKAGIVSMRERIALLNGVVSLTSAAGHGTDIDFTIPLSQA